MADSSEINFESIARWLYDVLDGIDSASDHARDDDVKYRKTVERLQRLKNEVGHSLDGYNVVFRNPPEAYGLTRLWHPCTPTAWLEPKNHNEA